MSKAVVLENRFQLDAPIGRGGMAEVWSAHDRKTNTEVAVKFLHGVAASDPALVERFAREGELLARLKSPHICKLIARGHTERGAETGANRGVPYLVLERLHGETLEQLLARERSLSLAEIGAIGSQILQGLAAAHAAGVVHRDLSPPNVFLDSSTGHATVKLIDFGIAKAAGGPSTTGGTTMGTLQFIAPEQLGESGKAGPRADLYAVGGIVFFALSGQLPFGNAAGMRLVTMKRETDPPSIDEVTGETWPAAVKTFLAKTLARAPAKRYASAEVAKAALLAAARGKTPALRLPEPAPGATATLTRGNR